jgi:hypothetical protein
MGLHKKFLSVLLGMNLLETKFENSSFFFHFFNIVEFIVIQSSRACSQSKFAYQLHNW